MLQVPGTATKGMNVDGRKAPIYEGGGNEIRITTLTIHHHHHHHHQALCRYVYIVLCILGTCNGFFASIVTGDFNENKTG